MSDLDINALVLAWMTTYGAPMIAALLFFGALGIPLPSTLIVIAAGAFVRQNYLNLYSTPLLGLFGAVAGDMLVYGVGRFARIWIDKRYGQSPNWIKSQEYFARRGGIAIYLTRWLLTILALPVSLVAGSSDYPFAKFVLFVVAGELTWIMLYGGLGYMFGSQWELISEFISQFAVVILGVLVVAIGVYLLVRFWRRSKQESADVG
jgi:membrane-associated protein